MPEVKVNDNDLVIVIRPGDPADCDMKCVPNVTISIGGEPVGLIRELNLNASSKRVLALLEVKVLSPETEGISDQVRTGANNSLKLLKKAIPFINIKSVDLDGKVLHEQGLDLSAYT